jgi:hypothetical protein
MCDKKRKDIWNKIKKSKPPDFFEKLFPKINSNKFPKVLLLIKFVIIFFAVYFLLIGLQLMWTLLPTFKEITLDILSKNLGSLTFAFSGLIFYVVFGVSAIIIFAFTFLYWAFEFKFIKEWIPLLIILSSFFIIFTTGMFFIGSLFGVPENTWIFNQNGNNANFECGDYAAKLVYEHKITCTLKPVNFEIQSFNRSFEITLYNGTILSIENDSFLAPNRIANIKITYDILTTKNETIKLNANLKPEFYSEEQYEQRKKDFLTYFFALLFLSIVTIPITILKILKNIGYYDEKKELKTKPKN